MRDFRDSKVMAHAVRGGLAARGLKITVGQSLELIAEAFGVADWNTLSAAIQAASAPSGNTTEAATRGGRVGFTSELQATLHRAVLLANERRDERATLEHLLLALTDDADAVALIKAYGADPGELKAALFSFLENLPPRPTGGEVDSAKPSASFQRVIQRAVLDTQVSGRLEVTGAQLLIAIFSEEESRAAQLLNETQMTRTDAVSFMIHNAKAGGGDAAASQGG